MSWTDERIDRLKELWTQGMTASQIADEIGSIVIARDGCEGKYLGEAGCNRAAHNHQLAATKERQKAPMTNPVHWRFFVPSRL